MVTNLMSCNCVALTRVRILPNFSFLIKFFFFVIDAHFLWEGAKENHFNGLAWGRGHKSILREVCPCVRFCWQLCEDLHRTWTEEWAKGQRGVASIVNTFLMQREWLLNWLRVLDDPLMYCVNPLFYLPFSCHPPNVNIPSAAPARNVRKDFLKTENISHGCDLHTLALFPLVRNYAVSVIKYSDTFVFTMRQRVLSKTTVLRGMCSQQPQHDVPLQKTMRPNTRAVWK